MKTTVKQSINLLIICFSLFFVHQSHAQCHLDDWNALKAIYESTNGDQWDDNATWGNSTGWNEFIKNQSEPPTSCDLGTLRGVKLNEGGRVASLWLASLYLLGNIPPEIGNLSQLDTLSIISNNLSGEIPPEIGNLSQLKSLGISYGDLSGEIPPEIGNLIQLRNLHISSTNLSGEIPSEIGNLNQLEFLSLGWNNLSGEIPPEISNLSQLRYLNLVANNLTGEIPAGIGDLSALTSISLYRNQLTGNIPIELTNLKDLEILFLNENQLTGEIPYGIGNLSKLRSVMFQNNALTGSVPDGFGLLEELVQFFASSNQLSGCHHPNLATMCNRKFFRFAIGENNFDASWEDFCESGEGVCEIEEEVIFGCLEAAACNYNPNTNYVNNSCIYFDPLINCSCDKVTGCMDPNAANYNALANCDNGFCEYENTLTPDEYDFDFCHSSVTVNLQKICPLGIFEIVENTSNTTANIDDSGLLIINNPNASINANGQTIIDETGTIEGTIKITLKDDEIRCKSEWTFNMSKSTGENCHYSETDRFIIYYPWLSHLISPSNCNNDALQFYHRIVEGDIIIGYYIYVTTENGGVLYTEDGEFLCTDYENGESTCAERYDLYAYHKYWLCSENSHVLGCTWESACNYLPDATFDDKSCVYYNCYDALQYVECPENNTTAVCALVGTSPLTLEDFITTDDPNILSEFSLQVQERKNVQSYYTTTYYDYTIYHDFGITTCQTRYHVSNQFLDAPQVSQSGIVCEEDLWSHVKIGTEQYKIYADDNGEKGEELSTCNTPSLICSTADLGVDTNVPGKYNFWTTAFFEFPDGSICESEATLFSVDVQPKPVAELSVQNKTVEIGEDIFLMDLVTTQKSGYWSGENVIYLVTDNGENIAYFSASTAGVYKLYYTVKNEFCEQSYLLVVSVGNTIAKPIIVEQTQKPASLSFDIYPNPSKNKVFIGLPDELNYQINLMDISGKVMRHIETKVGEKIIQMNVNGLPNGMYMIELKNEQNHKIQKLIIE